MNRDDFCTFGLLYIDLYFSSPLKSHLIKDDTLVWTCDVRVPLSLINNPSLLSNYNCEERVGDKPCQQSRGTTHIKSIHQSSSPAKENVGEDKKLFVLNLKKLRCDISLLEFESSIVYSALNVVD